MNSYAELSSYLQWIAHANGYHLVNGYRGLYFGSAGPFVDESLILIMALLNILCFALRNRVWPKFKHLVFAKLPAF